MNHEAYPFELPPLEYPYDFMDPYIDSETMFYHHDKHFRTYVDNLNKLLKPYPNLHSLTLEQILTRRVIPQNIYTDVMNNAGGVYNHALFFERIAPAESARHTPNDTIISMIDRTFGSFERFKQIFAEQALKVFGSGWTVLVMTRRFSLRIINLRNQETIVPLGVTPIIIADVWEHAYYLKYKNLRSEYLNNFWNIAHFPDVLGKSVRT